MFREAPATATASGVAQGVSPAKDRATYAFRLAVARTPKPDEVAQIVASYNRHLERFRKDSEAATRVLKGYAMAGVDPAEQAAWTLVANALLNLDEALTRE